MGASALSLEMAMGRRPIAKSGPISLVPIFWYFMLTIQNTTTSQVRNLFSVNAVFISFSAASKNVRHGRKA
jgi:hypothetical protein